MKTREFWYLMAPSLLVMGGLLAFPLFRTVQWSLEEVAYGTGGSFIGFDNYAAALTDARFGRAVVFTISTTLIVTAILLVLGYLIAVGLNRLGKTRPLVLGILLVSYVLPSLVAAVAFSWLFNDNFGGVVNRLIEFFGGEQVLWFTDPFWNQVLIIANEVWTLQPFAMLIILAGLQGVPEEIKEAARIDGANGFQTHLHIIIPTIRGVMGFVTLIAIMDVLRVFDSLVALSPQASVIGNESIQLYVYSVAFANGAQNLGLGSAINVLTILIILVMLIPFIRGIFKEAKAAR
ncbi:MULTISPECIES: carbohydrate ABC transporter permease [Microbacterium]|uniref:carbohydrate ABC transporter permease n=1 Tax=Microbacterium TaxID=33882 RepID=UPI002784EB23|nr:MULTISPECIES: sugar ABC transporter permease [Microbacterium]MDQ1082482.1 ABC-type sugar transport system permease subunit [Microbacterium sp. SORGH_AS_0344]MDQ1168747.1 ABC-type sugar transport system permease subunit [Microbacterium proteolyticum]